MKNIQERKEMRCFLNEYSLRGQFSCFEEFFESLRDYTLPLLDKISAEDGFVLLKKMTFWKLEICNGYTIQDVIRNENRNVRFAEVSGLKVKLQKILYDGLYWDDAPVPCLKIERYKFDEEFCNHFESDNCFLRALEAGGYIVSFWHESYKCNELEVDILKEGEYRTEKIGNLACVKHWAIIPFVRKWDITDSCSAFVRLHEADRHRPHFHVECGGYSGSFDLASGIVMKQCGAKLSQKKDICEIVKKWHGEHLKELQTAWNEIQGHCT